MKLVELLKNITSFAPRLIKVAKTILYVARKLQEVHTELSTIWNDDKTDDVINDSELK